MDTALWFSGGKDSMACLYLYRQDLPSIHVIWGNADRNYPEALEIIERAKSMCPNWHEVKSDRVAQWERHGLPSDLVPVDVTDYGQQFAEPSKVKVQSYLQCCYHNLIEPVWRKTKELGCTKVIRGQRKDERHKAPGKYAEGITFIHPIEDWTEGQVKAYLKEVMGPLPEHYALEHSSMDCFDCTAFAEHSLDRVQYMKVRHPVMFAEYMDGLRKLKSAIDKPLHAYARLLCQ